LAGNASTFGVLSRAPVSTQQPAAPATGSFKINTSSSAARLASGIDQVTITPERIETPKGMTPAFNNQMAGASMSPGKSFSPRATADYSQLGVELKRQMVQSYPKATPELSDTVAPKLENNLGPMPSSKVNGEALHAMRAVNPPDTRAIHGNPEATVSKLRPIRDSLSMQVGKLSPGQGSALIGAGMKTAAAQAAVVRNSMNETQDHMAASRKRLKVMQDQQREHSVRIARRLKVKFDSIPQHLRDFAARAGKELLVPAGLEKTPLEKMLGSEGVVGFKGAGMAAYEEYMANQ
jgi:hypothetical protein